MIIAIIIIIVFLLFILPLFLKKGREILAGFFGVIGDIIEAIAEGIGKIFD